MATWPRASATTHVELGLDTAHRKPKVPGASLPQLPPAASRELKSLTTRNEIADVSTHSIKESGPMTRSVIKALRHNASNSEDDGQKRV